MASRLELQSLLEELLGSKNVYYDPPTSLNMKYPAIRYSKSDIQIAYADNTVYSTKKRYEIVVIDKTADNPVIDKLLHLPYCSFDRHYKSENLNHDVLALYY